MRKYMGLSKGFTLVELMVTIAIMGIMAAIAFPNMSNFIANARLSNRAEQAANLFRFAKGEAVRMGVPVVVCGVTVRTDGRPAGVCDASKIASGLMAYADNNKNGVYDDGTDVMLRSVSINGNDNPQKMNTKVDLCGIGGNNCSQDSTIAEYVFFSNGTFGYKIAKATTQTDFIRSVKVGQAFVRISISDKNKTILPARYTVVAPSGTATTCKAGNVNNQQDGFTAVMKTICA